MIKPAAPLELADVALSRGSRQLVSALSFRLEPGQLALITGPNGCGKTTLLRGIAGLAVPDQGSITLGGRPVARLEPEERGQLAYQGHLEGLKKDLTVKENISFYSEIRASSIAMDEVLMQLEIAALGDRAVRSLSAGQKRRASLATTRLSGAGTWLLDEPLTNLDPTGRQLVAGWIDQHLAASGSAVIATHLAAELSRPGSLLVEL